MLKRWCKLCVLAAAIVAEPVAEVFGIPHPHGLAGMIANAVITLDD